MLENLCVIQVRNSSVRLPYKSIKLINKISLIEHVYNSVKLSKKLNKIIVATSNHNSDNEIEKICKNKNITCFRGSRLNVAKRFEDLLKIYKPYYFIRISGDSPLLDYKIINDLLILSKKNKYDIITNVFPRTYPKGQSVEIIKTSVFLEQIKQIYKKKNYYENVTTYFYKYFKKFKIDNLKNLKNYSNINLSVDTENDFEIIKGMIILNKAKYKSWYYNKNLYLKIINGKYKKK